MHTYCALIIHRYCNASPTFLTLPPPQKKRKKKSSIGITVSICERDFPPGGKEELVGGVVGWGWGGVSVCKIDGILFFSALALTCWSFCFLLVVLILIFFILLLTLIYLWGGGSFWLV